jgi:Predicted membrane protein (DUF2306)
MSKNFFQKIFLWLIGGFLAIGVWVFGAIMLGKTIPYFSFEYATNFLGTKQNSTLDQPIFRSAFYVHITSALVVMVVGIWQFFPIFLRKKPVLHRFFGKIYVFGILILAAPSGMVLAYFANGGLTSRVGFSLQCIVWFALTAAAFREILRKNWQLHIHLMLRSYAVTMAAWSLRTESYFLFYYLGTKPIETYQAVTWLSWVGNLVLIEWAIYFGLGRWLFRKSV